MSVRALAVSALACAALTLAAAALLDLSLADAVLLAPVIVATLGATALVVVLWVKIAAESLRAQRHPRRILAGGLAALGVLVVLSFFVELPGAR